MTPPADVVPLQVAPLAVRHLSVAYHDKPVLWDVTWACPNAALEALASGLPIVTSTTCGAQEWVRPGENGWVLDAIDEVALAERLDDLAALAGNAEARQAARARVEPLTLTAMADRLLALYRTLSPVSV